MSSVFFEEIYIFDLLSKEAYALSFKKGVNIITSSEIDGTDRGKSVLLRSLYHALGADSYFDEKWSEKHKVYILKFQVDKIIYYIYRAGRLFKIFDSNQNIIFSTNTRSSLSKFLGDLWGFTIQMPQRDSEILVVAPPVYTYLGFYVDQDYYRCAEFASFKRLSQFSDYKMRVIYSYLGVYDEHHFEMVNQRDYLKTVLKTYESEIAKNNEMKAKVSKLLRNISTPLNIDELESELILKSNNYSNIINCLNQIRIKLINFRNELREKKLALFQIDECSKAKTKDIRIINKQHICPECEQPIEDRIRLRSRKHNELSDIVQLKNTIDNDMHNIADKITKEKEAYLQLLESLKEYEQSIAFCKKEIDDYAKYKGLNQLLNNLNGELFQYHQALKEQDRELKKIEKLIQKTINEKTHKIDHFYSEYLKQDTIKFGLNELTLDKFCKISKSFSASGSNKPFATVMWYLTLHKLRKDFPSNLPSFPMVFDSPTNAEMDTNKRTALNQYILDSAHYFDQMIVSCIGFEKEEYTISGDLTITELNNAKYKLLNKDVYEQNLEILTAMNDATINLDENS